MIAVLFVRTESKGTSRFITSTAIQTITFTTIGFVLCWNCHQSHNQGGSPTDAETKQRKRTLIAKTLTQYAVNALKNAARNEEGVVALPFLVYHLVELGYLDEQEQQMGYGTLTVTKRYTATDEGKRIAFQWNL